MRRGGFLKIGSYRDKKMADMKVYNFDVRGSASRNQTWTAVGTVNDGTNNLMNVMDLTLKAAFDQLTQGKAVFGQPRIGCSGPYDIHRIVIEQVRHEARRNENA